MRTVAITTALLLVVGLAQAAEKPLTEKSWRKVLKQVMPDKGEQRWTAVGWRPTLWDAVIDAHKEKKPILLWAMNGHALACT